MPNVEGFAKEEIARLEKRFQKLDIDKSGSISVGEFLSVPELKENPLVQRVVDVFDSDMSGEVDFTGEKNYIFDRCIFAELLFLHLAKRFFVRLFAPLSR